MITLWNMSRFRGQENRFLLSDHPGPDQLLRMVKTSKQKYKFNHQMASLCTSYLPDGGCETHQMVGKCKKWVFSEDEFNPHSGYLYGRVLETIDSDIPGIQTCLMCHEDIGDISWAIGDFVIPECTCPSDVHMKIFQNRCKIQQLLDLHNLKNDNNDGNITQVNKYLDFVTRRYGSQLCIDSYVNMIETALYIYDFKILKKKCYGRKPLCHCLYICTCSSSHMRLCKAHCRPPIRFSIGVGNGMIDTPKSDTEDEDENNKLLLKQKQILKDEDFSLRTFMYQMIYLSQFKNIITKIPKDVTQALNITIDTYTLLLEYREKKTEQRKPLNWNDIKEILQTPSNGKHKDEEF